MENHLTSLCLNCPISEMGGESELTCIRHIKQCLDLTELLIVFHSLRQQYPHHQCSIVCGNKEEILSFPIYSMGEQSRISVMLTQCFFGTNGTLKSWLSETGLLSSLPASCPSLPPLHHDLNGEQYPTENKPTCPLFTLNSLPSQPSFTIKKHTLILFCVPKWLKRCQ